MLDKFHLIRRFHPEVVSSFKYLRAAFMTTCQTICGIDARINVARAASYRPLPFWSIPFGFRVSTEDTLYKAVVKTIMLYGLESLPLSTRRTSLPWNCIRLPPQCSWSSVTWPLPMCCFSLALYSERYCNIGFDGLGRAARSTDTRYMAVPSFLEHHV